MTWARVRVYFYCSNKPADEEIPSKHIIVGLANQKWNFKISRNLINLLMYLEKLIRGQGKRFICQSEFNAFFGEKQVTGPFLDQLQPEELTSI